MVCGSRPDYRRMRLPFVNPGFRRLLFLSLVLSAAWPLRAGQIGNHAANIAVKTAPAVPAQTLSLNVHGAVRLALEKNYAIRVEKYAPAVAQARVTQALGTFDPVLTARGQRSDNNNPQLIQSTTGGDFGLGITRTVSELLDVDVAELTPIGTIISLGTSVENDNNDADTPRKTYSTFAGLTLTQPLLQGFGTEATLSPIRLARKDLQTSQWDFQQTVIDTITETAQAYDDLYFTRENLGVAERSRDLAQRLLDDNERKVKIGVLTPLDVSVARSQLAQREETILTARQTMHTAENELKLRVSDDVESFLSVKLQIAPPETHDPGVADFNADLPHALERRPDYQQATIELARRRVRLVFDRNQSRPRLDLSASLGSNGLDRQLGNSLAQAYRGENLGVSVGLNATIPFPNRAGRGQTEASRLGVAQELVALKQLEQQIIVRLDNAGMEVRTQRASIAAATEALRLAHDSLDAEQTKLAEGTSTTYVVLQLQSELATAESNLLRAQTNYLKAVAEYEREAGRTLERNGVQLALQ